MLVNHSCPALWHPMDYSPPGTSVHGDSPSKSTRVDCHVLLQGIFPTQGSDSTILHCRQILYQLSYQGSPNYLYMDIYPLFFRLFFHVGYCRILNRVSQLAFWEKKKKKNHTRDILNFKLIFFSDSYRNFWVKFIVKLQIYISLLKLFNPEWR